MLQYKRLQDDQFLAATREEILAPDQPFYLFLGGLLHLNGLGFGGGLASILNDVSWQGEGKPEIPVYVALRASTPDIGLTARAMYDFYNEERLSPEAYALVDDLLLPQPGGDLKTTRQALSKINLIGYSYGTSLIQQTETILAERLEYRADADGVATCMGALGAVNIGPVACPRAFRADGAVVRLGYDVPDMAGTQGLFSQAFFLRRNDKINDDVMEQTMTGSLTGSGTVKSYGPATTKIIVDGTGDAYLRRIGFTKLAGGILFPRIDHSMDVEGHDLRLYTNHLSVKDNMAVFPSAATAAVTCRVIQNMGAESAAVHEGARRRFQIGAAQICATLQDGELDRLHRVFASAAARYNSVSLAEGKKIIERVLADAEAQQNRLRVPETPFSPAPL